MMVIFVQDKFKEVKVKDIYINVGSEYDLKTPDFLQTSPKL